MKEYIGASNLHVRKALEKMHIYGKPVQAIKPFEKKINFSYVVDKVEELVPKYLMKNIDAFYVGNFADFFKGDREFNAMYKDGAVYISPDQDDEEDLLDDIVHEIAHSLEEEYNSFIYGDGSLEAEFLGKRRTLYHFVDKPTLNMLYYNNPEYDENFDNHMYKDIGYDKLRLITPELFYSPYAITSLREYWANGFENYLLGDRSTLKDISPVLYQKIYNLFEQIED